MITALTEQTDRAEAFDAGVDDFMTKPFVAVEVVRRIGALIRRKDSEQRTDSAQRRVGDIELDLVKRTIDVDGRLIRLTPVECSLLGLLASDPGRAFRSRRDRFPSLRKQLRRRQPLK